MPSGADWLGDPLANKGTAFTPEERARLGLTGLLPPRVETIAEQARRVLAALRAKPSPLEQYLFLAALLAAGCAAPPEGEAWPALTFAQLRNAEYWADLAETPRRVKLEDGSYHGEFAPGSAAALLVTLEPAHAIGDLDGDGAADAAVVLAQSSGGSGTFKSLVLVANRAGRPQAAASVPLGDRVVVKSAAIRDDRMIEIEVVKHGPGDPACCPTLEARLLYRLDEGRLITIYP